MDNETAWYKDKDLMLGLTGVGNFGLGLAQYLSMKPVLDTQLKALKQNLQYAKEAHNYRNHARDVLGNALSSAPKSNPIPNNPIPSNTL